MSSAERWKEKDEGVFFLKCASTCGRLELRVLPDLEGRFGAPRRVVGWGCWRLGGELRLGLEDAIDRPLFLFFFKYNFNYVIQL